MKNVYITADKRILVEYASVEEAGIDKSTDIVSISNVKNLSDGYHTFKELYDFRMLYNASFFNALAADKGKYGVHKSWKHNDGETCFGGGWFIVAAKLPTGVISNHYKAEYWDLFDVPEEPKSTFEFDGHAPEDVVDRITTYLLNKY